MGASTRTAATGHPEPSIVRPAGADLDAWLVQRPEPALVLFDTSWSAACRLELGILGRLASHFSSRLRIGALDAAAHRDVSSRFQITWVPTLVLFQAGRAIARWEGARDAEELIREIESTIATIPGRVTSSVHEREAHHEPR